jgi:hypothetical protein
MPHDGMVIDMVIDKYQRKSPTGKQTRTNAYWYRRTEHISLMTGYW